MKYNYLRRLEIRLVRGSYQNRVRGQIRGAEQVYATFRDLKDGAKETVIGLYLDADLLITSYEVLSLGGSQGTILPPDEVFRGAILTRSKYIVVIHNHPSGDPKPSPEDRRAMERLANQAEVMDKFLLDFLIIGNGQFWSWFDEQGGGSYESGAVRQYH